jgi:hypothetical protein
MNMFRPSTFLRRVLVADAAAGAACGLLMVLAQGPLSELLGLPVVTVLALAELEYVGMRRSAMPALATA